MTNTDLRDTPIAICLSETNVNTFQKSVRALIERNDVEDAQLFFWIAPALDEKKVKRVIYDIGVKKCNVISEIYDEKIIRFIETFPESDYINKVISLIRQIMGELSKSLEDESSKCEVENKKIHVEIDRYEEILNRLKDVHSKLLNRDNLEEPHEWAEINDGLERKISGWWKRKTKIANDTEAGEAAKIFEQDLDKYFKDFTNIILTAANRTAQAISEKYFLCYQSAEFDREYQVETSSSLNWNVHLGQIVIADSLMQEFREEDYGQKVEMFKILFSSLPDIQTEDIRKVYYLETWRNKALEIVKPLRENLTQELFKQACEYDKHLAEVYIAHTEELIEEQTRLKDREVSKLSDKEKMLQDDMDCLTKFQDKLKEIESA